MISPIETSNVMSHFEQTFASGFVLLHFLTFVVCRCICLNRHAISSTNFYWSESKDNQEPFPLASSHNKVLLFGNGLSVFLQQLLSSDFMMTMVH
jgi:hypothetical protein